MRALVIPDQRVVQGASTATLSYQFTDADGEPADPSGTVTVTVTDSSGTALAANAAASGSGTDARTYDLTSGLTEIDQLQAVWAVDGTAAGVTLIHVVGGVYATVAQLRASEPTLERKDDVLLRQVRAEVEQMIDEMCNRSFAERPSVERLDGTGRHTVAVAWPNVQSVKWAKQYHGTSSRALTADQIASIPAGRGPNLTLTDGTYWDRGHDNVEVCYVHGINKVPDDIRRVTAALVERQVTVSNRSLTDNATQFFPPEGGSVMISQPGMRGSLTGIPWVDEILKRYQWRNIGVY